MNITETDLAVAAALYPILVECARESPARPMTYGDLINEAKARFPNNEVVQNAIPVSLGRRLDVVRMFLNKESLPDLTVLVVNAGTGEVGSAFGADPVIVRAKVAAFDWSAVAEEFDLHISGLRNDIAITKRPKISRGSAKVIMVDFYQQNRASYLNAVCPAVCRHQPRDGGVTGQIDVLMAFPGYQRGPDAPQMARRTIRLGRLLLPGRIGIYARGRFA